MVKSKAKILSLMLPCLIISAAQAQVTVKIDVATISCKQFMGYEIANPNTIALWLSGYYNGQKRNTTINVQNLKGELKKVKDFCIGRPTVSVMQAAEAVDDIGKTVPAQVTIDVSQITCAQFRRDEITDLTNIAAWLAGYYNGQQRNTVVNVQSFKDDLERVKDYCLPNPTVTVMQAVEAVLGKAK